MLVASKKDGVFIWDSGDLESEFRPDHSALLHDPYRAVREILRNDEIRATRLSEMSSEEVLQHEGRLDRIFPGPYSMDVILDALSAVGFSSETHHEVVGFSNDDAERFALVPRLSEIAAPLLPGEERDEAIKKRAEDSISRDCRTRQGERLGVQEPLGIRSSQIGIDHLAFQRFQYFMVQGLPGEFSSESGFLPKCPPEAEEEYIGVSKWRVSQ